ncbi:MAG: thiopurine S-methyltransferase [Saccharospirillaceae bacterium]|nr:thiopurine S-methyltransferase [Pseudomonadales bacterium]NRB79675.1 thiopurine S-methyltransferase [Saccharospirillaceae bacterium]
MKASFWFNKWEKGEIGFHESEANQLLQKYVEKFNLTQADRVFLPLCGKTRDIAWLLAAGYKVVGAELSQLAITDLFKDLVLEPVITQLGELIHFSAKDIDIFVGDIFKLTSEIIGAIDVIYDRAALVALPQNIRGQYTAHLIKITNNATQLLITFEYDQTIMNGPPFCIDENEVNNHYTKFYEISSLENKAIVGGFRGNVEASERAWFLQKK